MRAPSSIRLRLRSDFSVPEYPRFSAGDQTVCVRRGEAQLEPSISRSSAQGLVCLSLGSSAFPKAVHDSTLLPCRALSELIVQYRTLQSPLKSNKYGVVLVPIHYITLLKKTCHYSFHANQRNSFIKTIKELDFL